MNSIQFLATTVDKAFHNKNPSAVAGNQELELQDDNDIVTREEQKNPLAEIQEEEEEYEGDIDLQDDFYKDEQASISFWRGFVYVIFFLPNFLIVKPIFALLFIITYPIRFIMALFRGSSNIESVEDQKVGDQQQDQEDLIEVHDKDLAVSTGKQKKNSKKQRFVFPRLLINNNFNLSTPPVVPRKTLILDLDETLIHSLSPHNSSVYSKSKGKMIEIKLNNQLATLYYIYKRPFVDEFLNIVRNWYDLICFTASIKEYADPVINFLEEDFIGNRGKKNFKDNNANGTIGLNENLLFQRRYYRNHCKWEQGVGYIKDLSILTEMKLDPSKIIIIDNSPISYSLNRENGIMIEGWINDPNDLELMNLLPLLNSLRFTSDVRAILSLKDGDNSFEK
ncbi:hypothetical protein PACTADRAFT_39618 [Pachysolen tannophilus NRRL Y-2460]|uniref:Mitochondrial import inner membrane translocase subunit TIM50 n=1 Tax=Pachysolen tannophilus NRRL Y-2460 TaxID=669874 RepID=A0A1E4TYW7_PACTA|nr:hypothetical protein PACTADRAFT_39618 [Pachysolen tannophilus NRRL Y-2460]